MAWAGIGTSGSPPRSGIWRRASLELGQNTSIPEPSAAKGLVRMLRMGTPSGGLVVAVNDMLEREGQGETAGIIDDHLHPPGLPPHKLLGEAGDILPDHMANRGVGGRFVGQRHAQQDSLVLIATDTSPPVPELIVEGDVPDDLRVAGGQDGQDGCRTVGGGGETGEIAGITRDAPPAIENPHRLMDLSPGIRRARYY